MFTLHSAIPQLCLTPEYNDLIFEEENEFDLNYFLKKYNMRETKNNPKIILCKGNFYHFIKRINADRSLPEEEIYYLNIDLIKEVVSDCEVDIDGLILEMLAFGFFNESTRQAMRREQKKYNLNKKKLFIDSYKTLVEDAILKAQWVFHYETNLKKDTP